MTAAITVGIDKYNNNTAVTAVPECGVIGRRCTLICRLINPPPPAVGSDDATTHIQWDSGAVAHTVTVSLCT